MATTSLKTLIPPEVELEQPPIARIMKKTKDAVSFHEAKSSRANPEVEITDTKQSHSEGFFKIIIVLKE